MQNWQLRFLGMGLRTLVRFRERLNSEKGLVHLLLVSCLTIGVSNLPQADNSGLLIPISLGEVGEACLHTRKAGPDGVTLRLSAEMNRHNKC